MSGGHKADAEEPPVASTVLWGLKSDRTLQTRMPAQVGTWLVTGRRQVGYSLIRLPDESSAVLMTTFLSIDYWPEAHQEPLVFETQLLEMQTALAFDRFTRRTANYDDAVAAHEAALFELGRIGASWQ